MSTPNLPNNSIEHFTHPVPGHQLIPLDGGRHEFLCYGCMTPGRGKRYRCDANNCDFSLHDYCAKCHPRSLTSFTHLHNHALTLVNMPDHQQVNRTTCAVCADPVEGMFFRCEECEYFNVHPLCTQFPLTVDHPLDEHLLILQSERIRGFCDVCRGECAGWRYRCVDCNRDVHLECVLRPLPLAPENNAQTFQRWIPYPPPPLPQQCAGHQNYGPPPPYVPVYCNPPGPGLGGGGGNNNGLGGWRRSMLAILVHWAMEWVDLFPNYFESDLWW